MNPNSLKRIAIIYFVCAVVAGIGYLILKNRRMLYHELEDLAGNDVYLQDQILDLDKRVSTFESQRNPGTERLQTEAQS